MVRRCCARRPANDNDGSAMLSPQQRRANDAVPPRPANDNNGPPMLLPADGGRFWTRMTIPGQGKQVLALAPGRAGTTGPFGISSELAASVSGSLLVAAWVNGSWMSYPDIAGVGRVREGRGVRGGAE